MSKRGYRHKIRVRVNGLLIRHSAILMVQLHSPVRDELVWMPPGGGVEFGEPLEACLKREFLEETGLRVEVQSLQFINELVEPPFHAVELYFEVREIGGVLKLGNDPEHESSDQLLKDIRWIPFASLPDCSIAPAKLRDYLAQNYAKNR